MGRRSDGFRIRWKGEPPVAYVRFSHAGRRFELATGERDPVRAQRKSARIYADVIAGKLPRSARSGVVKSEQPFDVLAAEWLAEFEATHPDSESGKIWKGYVKLWLAFFGDRIEDITPRAIAQFTASRLAVVLRESVRKERSALRVFFAWLVDHEKLAEEDVPAFPKLKKTLPGKRATKRKTKPVDLTPDEVRAFIAALPEWSKRGDRRKSVPKGEKLPKVAVRGYFEILWETGLRPRTVQRLDGGVHFVVGAKRLRITDDIDKIRFGRELLLSERARAVLDKYCPPDGPIFGKHDLRAYIEPAARAAGLDPSKVALLSSYDLRHARGTYLVNEGGSLLGAAFNLGHKQPTTTNRYLRVNEREGDRTMELAEKGEQRRARARSGEDSGERRRNVRRGHPGRQRRTKAESPEISGPSVTASAVGARGFEPPTPRPPV